MVNLSLLVSAACSSACRGAILHLGTERHHERYLRDVGHDATCRAASR